MRKSLSLVVVAMWLGPALSVAQSAADTKVVRVLLRDVRTQAAIPEVELVQQGGQVTDRSDAAGVLRIRVSPSAPFIGQIRRIGYVPSSLQVTASAPGDSLVVLLAPTSAQTLDVVEVRTDAAIARYSAFDRRRHSGGPGIFLTDSQITKQGQTRVSDVFRRFPSLYMWDSSGTLLVTARRASKPVISVKAGKLDFDLAPCVMQVVVDEVRMPWGFNLDELSIRDIHGIEIYSGPATTPPEYKGTSRDSMCGMIAIWTKSR